jgi:hypothetical protein
MSKPINIIGQKYGRLTVTSFYGKKENRRENFWNCRCDCGNLVTVSGYKLRTGHTRSCGCLARELLGDNRRTHGMANKVPEYKVWCDMRRRCRAPAGRYKYWRGRGLTVCLDWDASFESFYDHVGPRPSPKHTLDRIDNNRGYEPGNVRWATSLEQSRNRRFVKQYQFRGKTACLTEWCEEMGVSYSLVHNRLRDGWTFERAITTPVRKIARPNQGSVTKEAI